MFIDFRLYQKRKVYIFAELKKALIMNKLKIIATLLFIGNMAVSAQNADFKKMLEYAIKAPSGHNTQPWKFKLMDNSIEIHPNLDCTLAVVDANRRELYISLGCATENLCIAAHELGYNTETDISPENNEYIIRIKLEKAMEAPEPLFRQIEKRQTNRSVYKSRMITNDTIQMLRNNCSQSGAHCYFYKNRESLYQTLADFTFQGNKVQMSDKNFKNELKKWIRYNKKQVKETKDGLTYAVMGSPSMPKWIGKPIVSSFLNPKAQNKSDKIKINSSSHFVLFTTNESKPENWIMLGRSLEQFLLKCTELGIAIAFLNQSCEVEQLATKLQTTLPIHNEYPMLLLRIGYADPMPYSPRKPLDNEIIK